MTTENRNAPTQKPTDIVINPGDEAPPDTTGTGEKRLPGVRGYRPPECRTLPALQWYGQNNPGHWGRLKSPAPSGTSRSPAGSTVEARTTNLVLSGFRRFR